MAEKEVSFRLTGLAAWLVIVAILVVFWAGIVTIVRALF